MYRKLMLILGRREAAFGTRWCQCLEKVPRRFREGSQKPFWDAVVPVPLRGAVHDEQVSVGEEEVALVTRAPSLGTRSFMLLVDRLDPVEPADEEEGQQEEQALAEAPPHSRGTTAHVRLQQPQAASGRSVRSS